MEKKTSEENDSIHCFKAILQSLVPRLPYQDKKPFMLPKQYLESTGYLLIVFVWFCTCHNEMHWHTIITKE